MVPFTNTGSEDMFSGIIEAKGSVERISQSGSNLTFWIKSSVSNQLKVDQSLAHNGVCLTVEALDNDVHQVTAIKETLDKSSLGDLATGSTVNLERCITPQTRLDGHMVQGHVDAVGVCTSVEDQDGSWLYTIEYPEEFSHLIVEKGSICLNGISLTAFSCINNSFQVAIIPYTYEHTTMGSLKEGDKVNLEFDIIGKYVAKMGSAYLGGSK